MENEKIRAKSIQSAKRLGVEIPSSLPLLDDDLNMRREEEIVARILIMHVIAAIAYGFDRDKAIKWLHQEKLTELLSLTDRKLVFENTEATHSFKAHIEGMWALAWALGIVNELDFSRSCNNEFVKQLPDLKLEQSSAEFRVRVKRRSLIEIIEGCDLAYCLHWGIRQCEITNKQPPKELKPHLIIGRRHALEWLLTDEAWEDISLDT